MFKNKEYRKPKFWNKVFLIFNFIVSLVSSILGSLNMYGNMTNFKIILLHILIYIVTFLIVLLLYLIIYTIRLYLCIKQLESKYKKLYEYNEKLKKNYNQLLENNKIIPLFLENIIKKLELAVTVPTVEEIDYIKKIIHLLNLDELIYNERKMENEKE